MSAEIIRLDDRRSETDADFTIDLHTAVDVAIRDLREIQANWGTPLAFQRLEECRALLSAVLANS